MAYDESHIGNKVYETQYECPECGRHGTDYDGYCVYCGEQVVVYEPVNDEPFGKTGYSGSLGYKVGQSVGRLLGGISKSTVLWVLGWLLFFPIPLSVLLYRSGKLNKGMKYGLLAALWLMVASTAFAGASSGGKDTREPAVQAEMEGKEEASREDAIELESQITEPEKETIDKTINLADAVTEPESGEEPAASEMVEIPDSPAPADLQPEVKEAEVIEIADAPEEVAVPSTRSIPEVNDSEAEVATPAYTFTDLNSTMYAMDTVNVRSEPSRDGSVIGSLSKNQSVAVTGQCVETGWYRINHNNQVGYASNDYLSENQLITLPNEQIVNESVRSNVVKQADAGTPSGIADSSIVVVTNKAGKTVAIPSGTTVYVSKSGGIAHLKSNCSNMKYYNERTVDAVASSVDFCSKCVN